VRREEPVHDPGHVGQQVDPAVAPDRVVDQPVDLVLAGDVGRDHGGVVPASRIAPSVSSSPAWLTSHPTTAVPSAASRTATARPIPDPAPVTTATRP
jgi:hypothetical protein